MTNFRVSIVTPDQPAMTLPDVVSLVIPSASGSVGVLAGHAPMIAAVGEGILQYRSSDDEWHYLVVTAGCAEVSAEGTTLTVGAAIKAPDLMHAEELLERFQRRVG